MGKAYVSVMQTNENGATRPASPLASTRVETRTSASVLAVFAEGFAEDQGNNNSLSTYQHLDRYAHTYRASTLDLGVF